MVFKTLKMKKLFYLLFAFAIIVACEKDMDDYDTTSINPIEAEIVPEYDYLSFIDGLAEEAPSAKDIKGSPNTARVGAAGTEWLHAIFFGLGPNQFVYLSADTDPESCIPASGVHASAINPVSVLYTFREVNGRGLLQVQVGNAPVRNQVVSNVAGYRNLFAIPSLNYVRRSNDTRSGTISGAPAPPVSAFDFSCAPADTTAPVLTASATSGNTITNNVINVAHDYDAFAITVVTNEGDLEYETGSAITPWSPFNGAFTVIAGQTGSIEYTSRATDAAGNITTLTITVVVAPAATGITWTPGTETNGMTMVTSSLGTYRLEAAPFPLTGMLATMESKTGAAATRNVRNFAGTSASDVRDAIEDDYEGVTNN